MNIIEDVTFDQTTLSRIADFLPYPFILGQRKNGILYSTFLNESFINEIGYTLSEIPTIDDWFNRAYPDEQYRKEIILQWNAMAEDAEQKRRGYAKLRVRITTKHKGVCWYEVKASITKNTHLAAFVNLQEILTQKDKLEELNNHKDKILSILSHDIRGPLGNIHALTKMATNAQLSQQEFLDAAKKINQRTFNVLELIETTLQWARSNFDTMQITKEEIQLHPLTHEVVSIYRDMVEHKNISVVVDMPENYVMHTDRSILKAVLRNVISNALKFTSNSGRVTIQSSSNYIMISDTGVGMSTQMVDDIMNRKYKSNVGTEHEAGIGIGLKLILDLLDRINAKMIIESKENGGTKIRIEF